MAHGQLAVVAKRGRVIHGEEISQPWGGKSSIMSTEFQYLKLLGKKRTCSSTVSEQRCPCPGWYLEFLGMMQREVVLISSALKTFFALEGTELFPPDTTLAHASAPFDASAEVQKKVGRDVMDFM